MRFQDGHGPLRTQGIFYNGVLVAKVPDDSVRAADLYWEMAVRYPGSEALMCCNEHPGAAAVDCLECWPLDDTVEGGKHGG